MSFASNPGLGMGRPNREQPPQEGMKLEPTVHPSDDVPLDLSMPRYPNRAPKAPRPGNSYFAAARSKGASASYDVDASDQPIDYSKKYVESNATSTIKSNYVPRNSLVLSKVKADRREREKTFSDRECKVDPYGDYAETDLDQPTDYSLRYAEDDVDDEEKRNTAYFAGNEQEDTVKTYCTEGTPYETPLNFSTATSMSDLRLEDAKEVAKKVASQDARNNNEILRKETAPAFTEEDEADAASTKESKNLSNELVLNSSSASIEKPVNYYEEGTPGRISRVSSLSSLGCAIVAQNEEVEEAEEAREEQNPEETTPALLVSPIPSVKSSREEVEDGERAVAGGDDSGAGEEEAAACAAEEEEKDDERGVDKEGKVVTFGGEDHYAEETPLMFSRSSSLGSLSGFEQHSIHDDRSSIVSDFSRRTSGVVSPSELPDSPTQTVPPSPRHNHRMQSNDLPTRGPPLRNFSYAKSPRSKPSVFEDNIAAFKEESTPIEFSAATSLSSLTIDDEPKLDSKEERKNCPEKARTLGRSLADENARVADGNGNEIANDNAASRDRENYRVQEPVSDGDEDDEDILAACINMGMRNSTYRQSFKEISEFDEKVVHRLPAGSATNLVRYQTSSTLDRLDALSPILKKKIAIDTVTVPVDTLRVYCTEDTPADISPVGSQSNLSALSMLSISGDLEKDERNLLSGDDEEAAWALSAEDDKILDECIQSGIPKARQANNSLPGNSAPQEYNSPSRATAAAKSDADLPRTAEIRDVPAASSLVPIESNGIPIHRESFSNWRAPPESNGRDEEEEEEERAASMDRAPISVINEDNLYDDSQNNSDDDAILTECILSAMPKARINPLPFVNSQTSRKTPEPPTRRSSVDEAASFQSSHVVTQVFHASVTRMTIRQHHETEELFTDTSSLSEDEEDLILAQCIRSGMPKASSVPPRIINVKKDDRGNNE